MSIAVLLSAANGAIYANHDPEKTDSSPSLVGFLEFNLDPQADAKDSKKKLRLEAAAWPKDKDGKKFYSLSFGGVPGTLFPEKTKKTADAPDYTGSFGFERELRLAGWKKTSDGGTPYISLSVQEKREKDGTEGGTPAGGAADFL